MFKYISISICILIVLMFGFIFLLAIKLIHEVDDKIEKPVNKLIETSTEFPVEFEAELNGWAVKKLCALDRIYPGFNKILDEATEFKDARGAANYEILENSVKVRITIYGKQNTEI